MVLSSEERLQAWEQASGRPPVAREIALACALGADTSETMLSRRVGAFHRLLLQYHQELFGPTAQAVARCPNCSTLSEFSFDTGEFLPAEETQTPRNDLSIHGYQLSVRLPNLADLLAAGSAGRAGEGVEAARECLINRCVLGATRDDLEIPVQSLPSETVLALAARLAESDPLGEIEMLVSCPQCRCSWSERFDIAAFVWSGLETSVSEILRDVHVLARAYGWSEREILAQSPERRRAYRAMVESTEGGLP